MSEPGLCRTSPVSGSSHVESECGKYIRHASFLFHFLSFPAKIVRRMCVSLSVHTYVHPSGGPLLCAVSGPTLWPVRFDVSTIRILRVVIDANLTENTQRECKTACVYVCVCGNCNRKEANLITSFSLFTF